MLTGQGASGRRCRVRSSGRRPSSRASGAAHHPKPCQRGTRARDHGRGTHTAITTACSTHRRRSAAQPTHHNQAPQRSHTMRWKALNRHNSTATAKEGPAPAGGTTAPLWQQPGGGSGRSGGRGGRRTRPTPQRRHSAAQLRDAVGARLEERDASGGDGGGGANQTQWLRPRAHAATRRHTAPHRRRGRRHCWRLCRCHCHRRIAAAAGPSQAQHRGVHAR